MIIDITLIILHITTAICGISKNIPFNSNIVYIYIILHGTLFHR